MSDPSSRALLVASHHVRVRRCPGCAAAQTSCHPDEEPGGYDVDVGLMCLTTRPVTLAQANHYAHQLRYWIATILDMERDGITESSTMTPQEYPVSDASLLRPPGAEDLAVLQEMVRVNGPLVCVMRIDESGQSVPSGSFQLLSSPESLPRVQVLAVTYEAVLEMERGGFLQRSMQTRDRATDARVLTAYGRTCVVSLGGNHL